MIVAVEALDGCGLDGPVHPLDLAVGPRVLRLGCAMFDAGFRAGVLEGVSPEEFSLGESFHDQGNGRASRARRRELDAVVGQHRVHSIGHGFDEMTKEIARDARGGLLVQLEPALRWLLQQASPAGASSQLRP